MKSVLRYFIIGIVLLTFAGCYTELATIEPAHREYADDSDTLNEQGTTVINNHYYLDDDYRQSRLRVSFQYYYPSYSSWIGAYYNSYFNDYYWGMYHRPTWYYDPFYTYYPGCIYPSPFYDPWYPYYYPPVVYYPVYYPTPIASNLPLQPGRPRPDGPTRDPLPAGDRPRPMSPTTTIVPTTERPTISGEAIPTERPRPAIDPKKGWWEDLPVERPVRDPNNDARPIETTKPERPPRGSDVNRPTGGTEHPNPGGEDRPIDRPKNNPPVYTPPPRDDRPIDRPKTPKTEVPAYTPPAKRPSGNDEARPIDRPRETSRPSFNPPPQSAPPQSAPPRSGGGSSSGGNGRKRD